MNEHEAELVTSAPIELYDNLLLQIGGDLYAKAVALSEGGARIHFTAKPPCFSAWLREAGCILWERGAEA